MTEPAGDDWPRLASFIEQRIDALHLQWKDVQLRGGPSTAKVREIRNGTSRTLSRSKRRDLERALEWSEMSVDAALAGDPPTPLPGSPPAPTTAIAATFSATGTLSAAADLQALSDDELAAEVLRRMKGERNAVEGAPKSGASTEGRPPQEVVSGAAAGQDREDWPTGWSPTGDEDTGMGGDEEGQKGDQLGGG